MILYDRISPIIRDTTIINCDEKWQPASGIKHIQLDNAHYYGSQYNQAINNIRTGQIMCIIVGDNIPNINYYHLFMSAIHTFNTSNVGVYAPYDKRSHYQSKRDYFRDNIYNVDNTDCGFWFIHPQLVDNLKHIDYTISKYGWAIDIITIREALTREMLVLRDYSHETDQLDHSCGYDRDLAQEQSNLLLQLYDQLRARPSL